MFSSENLQSQLEELKSNGSAKGILRKLASDAAVSTTTTYKNISFLFL